MSGRSDGDGYGQWVTIDKEDCHPDDDDGDGRGIPIDEEDWGSVTAAVADGLGQWPSIEEEGPELYETEDDALLAWAPLHLTEQLDLEPPTSGAQAGIQPPSAIKKQLVDRITESLKQQSCEEDREDSDDDTESVDMRSQRCELLSGSFSDLAGSWQWLAEDGNVAFTTGDDEEATEEDQQRLMMMAALKHYSLLDDFPAIVTPVVLIDVDPLGGMVAGPRRPISSTEPRSSRWW